MQRKVEYLGIKLQPQEWKRIQREADLKQSKSDSFWEGVLMVIFVIAVGSFVVSYLGL